MIRVYILAPTPMARTGLRAILEDNGAQVVGEGDGSAAPDLTEADVVLVDGDELLEDDAEAVTESGTQSLVLIAEDDRSIQRVA